VLIRYTLSGPLCVRRRTQYRTPRQCARPATRAERCGCALPLSCALTVRRLRGWGCQIYEGEGAVRADGLFNISRLRLSEIHRVERSHRSGAKGVASKGESHALNRIHFPPPPHPPPRPPPSLETGWKEARTAESVIGAGQCL
jgi:hypothetical protein